MSSFGPATIRCRCEHAYQVDVADGLHISLRPDIRQAILDGTFHRFECPRCGAATIIEDLLAYTDFPRKHWFTVVPRAGVLHMQQWLDIAHASFRATMIERAAPMVASWAPHLTRRLIFGLASLREKLLVFDAGLDDRIVELVKLQLIRDLALPARADGYFHLVAIDHATLRFEHAHPQGGVFELPMPRALYDRIQWQGDQVRATCPALFDGIAVDHRVALGAA